MNAGWSRKWHRGSPDSYRDLAHNRNERSMAHFLQVRVQGFRVLRVSRYNVYCEQATSQGTQNFIEKQVRGPDLSRFTKLSKYQNINAKNVTNLLILLSVLGAAIIF